MFRILFAGICLAAAMPAANLDTRVADAAMQGDRDAVRALVGQKADVNAAQGDGMTALHWAAFKDDMPMAQILLKAGASVKAGTRVGGQTPLFMACDGGDAVLVEALLKAGADPNAVNGINGQTPLMVAAQAGNADSVKALLDHGANPNAKETAHGQTALMFAAAANRSSAIRALVAHGADLKMATEVIHIAKLTRYDDNGNVIPERPAAAKATAPGDAAPAARGTGIPNVSKAATVSGGMTALLFAARDGQLDAAHALVELGAEVNRVTGGDKTSPIVMAIINGHYELAKYLLDHGADPNVATEDGLAALYATIDMQYAPLSWSPNPIVAQEKVSYLDLMKALIDKGADVNGKLGRKLWFRPTSHDKAWVNPQGATAFWRAAQSSDVTAMKLLLEHGADPKINSDQGDTPLMVAAGVGWGPGNFSQNSPVPGSWMAAVKFCLDLGMDINATDVQGFTALHGAAFRGDNEMVQFLVEKGARMDIKSKKGYFAADMANGIDVVFGLPLVHPETVALLEKLGSAPPVAPTVGTTSKARPAASK